MYSKAWHDQYSAVQLGTNAHLITGINSSLSSLNWEGGGISDPKGVIADLPVHDTHDLIYTSRSSVGYLKKSAVNMCGRQFAHHLDQSDCRDFDGVKVMRTIISDASGLTISLMEISFTRSGQRSVSVSTYSVFHGCSSSNPFSSSLE